MASTRRRRSVLAAGLCALLIATEVASAPHAGAVDRGSPGLGGTWEVIKVAAGDDQLHWAYPNDDPAHKYRLLDISASVLTLNDGSGACAKPAWTSGRRVGLYRWIESVKAFDRSLAGLGAGNMLDNLDPAIRDQTVQPVTVSCASPPGNARNAGDWSSYHFIAIAGGRLLLDDGGSGLWLLRKRGKDSPISPSYSCTRAASLAETAICKDAGLAGYDRSVAEAYRRLLDPADPDRTAAVRREQTEWIARRDACGADHDCLEQQMSQRISAMSQEAYSGIIGD